MVWLDWRRAKAQALLRAWRRRSLEPLAVMYQAGTGCGASRWCPRLAESVCLPAAASSNSRVAVAVLPAASVARTRNV